MIGIAMEELKDRYTNLENNYNNIINSKRWKIANKIGNFRKRK